MMENIFEKSRKAKSEKKERAGIIIDKHEKNSLVISELTDLGCDIEFRHLSVADFLIGDVAIERKTVSDFQNSMINKRLARQLHELKQYSKPLLLIEGTDNMEVYNDYENGINGNAIRSFLLSILLEIKVPIIFTKDYEDTAKFLDILSRKSKKTNTDLRVKKKSLNKKEQMQYILEGFPGIGPASAKKLLKKYKTIKKIIDADKKEIAEEIGKKADIFDLINSEYK